MQAPEFWARDCSLASLLAPVAAIYDLAGRMRRGLVRPVRAPVPIMCVGNLTAGGAGKTPVALAIGRRLREGGRSVHFLSRGYRGRTAGPLRVDPSAHLARDVGDEALLLAAAAPTWVSRDRPAGARAAAAAGAEVVVMDDGLQNPTLEKDVSLLVVDGGYGFGNGRVLPAGPLREAAARGLARADAVVLIDDPVAHNVAIDGDRRIPWLKARLVPNDSVAYLAGDPVIAFTGIGRPGKFFDTLRALGCQVLAARPFADHHFYDEDEIMQFVELASAHGARLVTTAKDWVRLPPEAQAMVTAVPILLEFEDPGALDRVLDPALNGG